ncbi:hypothetical protein FZC76_22295 [Sutcliffiella horikoshii]|uniref:Uncharacterized protein n=1 Tax=Sutcliffiella horikoshii TaxID=79883 RepID=A0A5D4SAD8_9BACI|nr:hypothetical protein FZC76_22295 [Sutcliffiella horikoshii]
MKKWSLVCLISCILLWIPNIIFQIASPLWMLTYIIGPIGMAFSLIGKNYILAFLNLVMTFSFFLFMAIGYYINSL